MKIQTTHRKVAMQGDNDVRDLTDDVREVLQALEIKAGIVTVFVPGSTAGVTTIEHEPGVVADLGACFDRIAPRDIEYAHERTWHDGNGYSHVRAGLLGPSLTIPVEEGRLLLGMWQQIVLVDFDIRPRQREFTITVVGQ